MVGVDAWSEKKKIFLCAESSANIFVDFSSDMWSACWIALGIESGVVNHTARCWLLLLLPTTMMNWVRLGNRDLLGVRAADGSHDSDNSRRHPQCNILK